MIPEKIAPAKAKVFAAFTPPDMAKLLTFGLSSAACRLYLYLHTIAPFGTWYCWNDEVSQQTVREVLRVKSTNPNSIRRTYERARKELGEKKLVAFSSRGFRILELMNRPAQQASPLEELFLDPRSRQNDRDQPPKPKPAKRSGRGIDNSNLKEKETKTQEPTHPPVCLKKVLLKQPENSESKPVLRDPPLPRPVQKPKLKQPKAAKRDKITRPAAFTELDEKYLIELEKAGIPNERINRNLARELNQHSWHCSCTFELQMVGESSTTLFFYCTV